MTRLKSTLLSAAMAALVTTAAANQSFAIEPGDFTNYLRGATQGLPLGALPPAGIYAGFGLNATGLGGNAGLGNQAIPGKVTAPAFGYGVNMLFVPGWKFLGATYGAAIVQGMYLATSESSINPPFAASSVSSQLANTTFTPVDLSWSLGSGLFAALAFNVIAPDGSQWKSTAASVDLNPDYWTLSPAFALSYLSSSWLLSGNFRYDINTASKGNTMLNIVPGAAGFYSGNELFGDLTALYKIGKWSIGPVAYFEAQTTADKPGAGISCAAAALAFGGPVCGYQSQVAVGGLIGYDFGPVSVQTWFDDTVSCKNAVCGLDVWGRMSFRLIGFEAPKPLVAKN